MKRAVIYKSDTIVLILVLMCLGVQCKKNVCIPIIFCCQGRRVFAFTLNPNDEHNDDRDVQQMKQNELSKANQNDGNPSVDALQIQTKSREMEHREKKQQSAS